jgi:hypothetical protein
MHAKQVDRPLLEEQELEEEEEAVVVAEDEVGEREADEVVVGGGGGGAVGGRVVGEGGGVAEGGGEGVDEQLGAAEVLLGEEGARDRVELEARAGGVEGARGQQADAAERGTK